MALINSLTSGVAALRAFSKGLEVIGDNVANVNTTGFKGSRARYEDSFSNALQRSTPSPADGSASNTSAMQVGTGVNVASIRQRFTQGSLQTTGLATDLGIAGNGFFRVKNNLSGTEYVTRAGDFRLDDNGLLVTNDGLRVQGLNDGAATFTATVVSGKLVFSKTATTPPATVGDLQVNADLTVANGGLVNSTGGAFTDAEIEAAAPKITSFATDKSGNLVLSLSNGESYTRGKVLLMDFSDPSALMREGGNLFSGMDAAGPKGGLTLTEANNTPGGAGLGTIESGTIELSNVDLTEEFSEMITTQRSFQAGSRIITVSDQVLEEVVNLKR